MSATAKEPTLRAQLLAEFLGTMLLIVLGDGVVAMVVLFGKGIAGEVVMGGFTNITLGWGLAVAMAVYLTRRVSGAHLNPAVTLALAVYRQFPWRKVLPYGLAQFAGAFAGAALVFLNYYPMFYHFDPELSTQASAGVFATFPKVAADWAWPYGLIDQVIGTAILVGMIFALTDRVNDPAPSWLTPLLIGLVVVAIGVSWGGMHGYAINPARDLGPRLFTLAAGFKNTGFGTNAAWVPVVGPLLGGLLGGLVYDRVIRPALPREPVSAERTPTASP
jgi:glycerol uptake facilitator protein